MSSICAEQQKFKKSLIRDLDNIPPRKLLTRRAAAHDAVAAEMFSDSPRFSSSEETLLQKFLPHNNLMDSDDDDSDPYSSDHFRMYEFKVRRCTRSRSHDWTDCPFAHPGEKARRRDPRRYHYSGTVCPEYRRLGGCSRGDSCEFAHGVFECWLHPARYRTEACKDGKNCKRKVCFFAHTPRQLRILPVDSNNSNNSAEISCNKSTKFLNPSSGSNNCCLFCCQCHSPVTSSPTSTLFGNGVSHFSPPLSPVSPVSPSVSPVKPRCANGVSPFSQYSDRFVNSEAPNGLNHDHGIVSYKDVLNELMWSLDGLNFNEASPVSVNKASNSPWLDVSPVSVNKASNSPWLDVSFNNCEDPKHFDCEDHQMFIFSPQTNSGSASFSGGDYYSSGKLFRNEGKIVKEINAASCPAPDLGWVNELLM